MRTAILGSLFLMVAAVATGQQPAFTEEEVAFQNGDVRLAGTLTLPDGKGPHPAVILVSGSGPQNRDSLIFGFEPFQILAHALAADGVAVLRYDDRGVGGSTGNIAQSTTADFAADALAGLELLGARSDIRRDARGIVGHSEGALAAAIAASRSPDVAFVVLMAGSTVPGAEVLRQQARDLARAAGASDDAVEAIVAAHRRFTDSLREGADEGVVAERMTVLAKAQFAAMPDAQRAMVPDIDAAVGAVVKQQAAAMRSLWMRHFLDFDPATVLERVTCPVLALFGGRDLQVSPQVHREPLERALARARNGALTVKVYTTANHLFQAATTGHPNEYMALEKSFVAPLVEDVSAWIRSQSR